MWNFLIYSVSYFKFRFDQLLITLIGTSLVEHFNFDQMATHLCILLSICISMDMLWGICTYKWQQRAQMPFECGSGQELEMEMKLRLQLPLLVAVASVTNGQQQKTNGHRTDSHTDKEFGKGRGGGQEWQRHDRRLPSP